MKLKTLIILLVLAGLLVGLAYYSAQKQKPSLMPSAIGNKVLPNLDVNRIGKLVITSKEGVTTVARLKDKWVVGNRFNYPANFDKVADTIRDLGELKIGQTVNTVPSQLGGLNLVSPIPTGTNRPSGAGTLVELRDEKNGLLATLIIGKRFMQQASDPAAETMMNFGEYPNGQYIQTGEGKVYLVSKTLDRLTEPVKTWLADDFINAPATNLEEIAVSGPNRAPLKLTRVKNSDSFALADLSPKEGILESSKVNQMAGALDHLGFDDVADPALSLKETGLDRPIVFKAITRDGLIYRVQIGNTLTNDTFDRYATISVTNEPPAGQKAPAQSKPEPEQQAGPPAPEQKNIAEQSAALGDKFDHWIYVIKSYRAEPMLFTRNDLIKKQEPPKAEAVQSNAPPKIVEETDSNPSPDRPSTPFKKAPKNNKSK